MNIIAKNTLAVVAGFALGSIANIALVNLGPIIVPLPKGADISSMEKLSESMSLFRPVNFLFPFLGHALGTLVGAFVAAKISASHSIAFAIVIGVCFLAGGISMVLTIGGPAWFNATDLILAYIPMAYLGGRLALGSKRDSPH